MTLWQCLAMQLTQRWRESIKPHLQKDYSTLCSSTVPVTKFCLVMTCKLSSLTPRPQTRLGSLQVALLLQGNQATRVVGPVKDTIFSGGRLSSAGRRITNFKVTRGAIITKRRSTNDRPVCRKNHHVIDKLQSLEVSQLTSFTLHLVDYFKSQASSFQAGRIAHCIDAWKSITADSEIFDICMWEANLIYNHPCSKESPLPTSLEKAKK